MSAWILRLGVGVRIVVCGGGVERSVLNHAVHHAINVEVLHHLAVRELVESGSPAESHLVFVVLGIALLFCFGGQCQGIGVECRRVFFIIA